MTIFMYVCMYICMNIHIHIYIYEYSERSIPIVEQLICTPVIFKIDR